MSGKKGKEAIPGDTEKKGKSRWKKVNYLFNSLSVKIDAPPKESPVINPDIDFDEGPYSDSSPECPPDYVDVYAPPRGKKMIRSSEKIK